MTREHLRAADPALASALDRLEPPPLSPGFADKVAAAAAVRGEAPLPRARPGARRRFGWSRGRHVVLGGAALLVAGTAAAAATGLLQRVGIDLEPVGEVVERVAAAVPGLRPPEPAPRPAPSVPATRLAEAEPAPAAQATPLEDPRRERLAQAIAARMERRIARAEARGIAVPEALRDTEQRLSPERAAANPERAALVERVQQLRRERRESPAGEGTAGEAAPTAVAEDADLVQIAESWSSLPWRARIRLVQPLDASERRRLFELLTPEQRAELLELRRLRREAGSEAQEF